MENMIKTYLKFSKYFNLAKKLLTFFGFSLSILGVSPLIEGKISQIQADEPNPIFEDSAIPQLLIFQENALISQSSPNNPEPAVLRKLNSIITAYSSTVWQTDDTPFITASGSNVRDGIIANNMLPFGTRVRIPELYGNKIFIVEDRMNWQKGNYHFDIWFSDYWQALNFGAKRTYIEILIN